MKNKMNEKNNNCHSLYVEWAYKHLLILNECIVKISNYSNLNMLDAKIALIKERDKLISTNPAYNEAWKTLRDLKQFIPLMENQ